jgi:predicted N-acyltransferase
VGRALDAAPDLIAEACRRALDEFEALSIRTRAHMLVLLDMAPGEIPILGPALRAPFEPVGTSPCAQLPLTFKTVDEYLATLSRTTRQKLRRRARSAAQYVRVERTTDIAAHLDVVYGLYRSTVERAPVSLGVQRRDYFARACREIDGAHYVLYWLGDHLIAFNLLIQQGQTLLDKYFCMDPAAGREHHLYFVSWLENVGWAIARGLSLYHAGGGAEETKAHLGCRVVDTQTMFRHTSPLAHRCLAFLSRRLVGSARSAGESAE